MDPIQHKEFDTITISSRRYNEFIDDIEDLKNKVGLLKQQLEKSNEDKDQFLHDKQCCLRDLQRLDNRIKQYEGGRGGPSG